jgi:hypothetical protein
MNRATWGVLVGLWFVGCKSDQGIDSGRGANGMRGEPECFGVSVQQCPMKATRLRILETGSKHGVAALTNTALVGFFRSLKSSPTR